MPTVIGIGAEAGFPCFSLEQPEEKTAKCSNTKIPPKIPMEPHGLGPLTPVRRPCGATSRPHDGAFLHGQRPCLHDEVPAFADLLAEQVLWQARTLRAGRRFGTQAWYPAAGIKRD